MPVPLARHTFALIVIGAVALTALRIMTAPDRIAERRATARTVCVSSGGQWTSDGRNELCKRRGEPAPR
jgi:hypothetical protein